MQEVFIKIGTGSKQKENQRHESGEFIAELPYHEGYGQMAERYQSYGQRTNVVVRGGQNLCCEKEVPDCDDPVSDNNQENGDASVCHSEGFFLGYDSLRIWQKHSTYHFSATPGLAHLEFSPHKHNKRKGIASRQ